MMVINKDMVEGLKERAAHRDESSQCLKDLKKMLEIKETLLWRAEVASCACVSRGWVEALGWEVRLIEEALDAVDKGDRQKAVNLLESYATHLEEQSRFSCDIRNR
jgi:hypothetical protein